MKVSNDGERGFRRWVEREKTLRRHNTSLFEQLLGETKIWLKSRYRRENIAT